MVKRGNVSKDARRTTRKRPASAAAAAVESAVEAPIGAPTVASPAPAPPRRGAARGSVDHLGPSRVSGWAWDPENPDERLVVSIEVEGAEVATVVADRFRPDLLATGKGDGAHGFNVELPGTGAAPGSSVRCVVKVAGYVLDTPDAAIRIE